MSDSEEYWAFRFSIEAQDGAPIPRSRAEALLEVIIEWVEVHGLQMGGGFRPPRPEDRTAPLYGEEGYEDS
jgi:hypothetical protein